MDGHSKKRSDKPIARQGIGLFTEFSTAQLQLKPPTMSQT